MTGFSTFFGTDAFVNFMPPVLLPDGFLFWGDTEDLIAPVAGIRFVGEVDMAVVVVLLIGDPMVVFLASILVGSFVNGESGLH